MHVIHSSMTLSARESSSVYDSFVCFAFCYMYEQILSFSWLFCYTAFCV